MPGQTRSRHRAHAHALEGIVPMVCHMSRRSAHHRRTKQVGQCEVPVVAMDFWYTTMASAPVLCPKCSHTGITARLAAMSKEATPGLVRLMSKDIDKTSWAPPKRR